MQLSVLCSEDASRVSPDELAHQTSKSVFGSHLIGSQLEACAIWPRAVHDDYYRPVISDGRARAVGRGRSRHAACLGRIGREAPLSREASSCPQRATAS